MDRFHASCVSPAWSGERRFPAVCVGIAGCGPEDAGVDYDGRFRIEAFVLRSGRYRFETNGFRRLGATLYV